MIYIRARQDGCAGCQNRKIGNPAALQGYSIFIMCIIHKNYFMAKSGCYTGIWLSEMSGRPRPFSSNTGKEGSEVRRESYISC